MLQSALALRVIIVALCLVGLYASYFMLRKYVRAKRGELDEPSVVDTPRAKVARVPNAAVGLIYYALMIALTPFLTAAHPLTLLVALACTIAAALSSLYLAYSLLFVTRMPCSYCWTSHIVNWSLLVLLAALRNSVK